MLIHLSPVRQAARDRPDPPVQQEQQVQPVTQGQPVQLGLIQQQLAQRVLPDQPVQRELIRQQLVQQAELVRRVLQVQLVQLVQLVDRVFKAYKAQPVILELPVQQGQPAGPDQQE